MPWGYLSMENNIYIYIQNLKSKNTIFDYETNFADSLKVVIEFSFVKLSSKVSKAHLVEGC